MSRSRQVHAAASGARRALAGALLACSAVVAACAGTSGSQVEVAPSTTTSEPATTTTAPPDCADQLPEAAQAGQLLMVLVTAPQVATEHLTSGRVGGIGLKGRQSANVGDEVASAVAEAPIDPFVASDEEGGTVQRLTYALGELSSAATLAEGSPQDAANVVRDYLEAMAGLGFDMNFAPVADVGDGSDLGSRTYGDDPGTVAGFVEAIVAAHLEVGITPVVKHWPGIGGGEGDPHVTTNLLPPLEELRGRDLTVFDRAIAGGAPAIMVAHAVVPGLSTEEEPTSLSAAAITGELRGRQGFDGLVITDSLGMGAVVETVPQDEAAVRAIRAGADVALLSGTDVVADAHRRLTGAIRSGEIPREQVRESVRRVLRLKGIEGPCLDVAAGFSTLQQEVGAELDAAANAPGTGDEQPDDGTTGGAVVDRGVTDQGVVDQGVADQGVNGSGSGTG